MALLFRLFFISTVTLLVVVPFGIWAQTNGSGGRVAVVVGNAAYPASPLANPRNDARAVTGALRELGFRVVTVEDATQVALKALVMDLPSLLEPGDFALFYYAGHAVQYRGGNYLLPVDFAIERPEQLPTQSVALDTLLNAMGEADVSVVVLDACRDYPFGSLQEAFGDGLAGVTTRGETLVAYSTAAGETALDGTGPNSPYTSAFVAALEVPGRDLYDVFRTIRGRVREATEGRQIPWISGSLETRLVLRSQDVSTESAEVASIVASVTSGDDPTADVAAVYWRSISQSADPADFAQFISAYPQSPMARLAAVRQSDLLGNDQLPVKALEIDADALLGPSGEQVVVTACDRFASDPFDPARLAPGVPWGLVNARQAVRACAVAVSAEPANPRLTFLFGRALETAERYGDAIKFYKKAAELGYAPAERSLGFMYQYGVGVAADPGKAAELYFDGALHGVPGARLALAHLLENGIGVPQSPDGALRWMTLAAEEGFPPAITGLGTFYRADWLTRTPDYPKALKLFQIGAALGDADAMANLGQAYRDGRGVEVNIQEAVSWLERATELGDDRAPYHLAKFYHDGAAGIARDPSRAKALLELAIDRGHDFALYRLATYHEGGKGWPPDLAQSAYYLLLSLQFGKAIRHPSVQNLATLAQEKLARIGAKMPVGAMDAAQGRVADWVERNGLDNFALRYRN